MAATSLSRNEQYAVIVFWSGWRPRQKPISNSKRYICSTKRCNEGTWPSRKNKRPLTIPFLAHSEFGYNLKKWLTDVIIQHKHRAVEFHVPFDKNLLQIQSNCCRSSLQHEIFHQTMEHAASYYLHVCLVFLEQYPTCRTTRGHVASAMSSLQLPGQLHQIVTFSANSQIYLGRQKYLKITQDLVQQWLRHHHLESIDIDLWQQFIHQEWPNHLTAAKFGVS